MASKLNVASTEYKKEDFVVVDLHDETHFPVFAKIADFVLCAESNTWYLVVQLFSTVDFFTHYHAYLVTDSNVTEYKVLKVNELLDYHPLCCYVREGFDTVKRMYIRMPYHVFKV